MGNTTRIKLPAGWYVQLAGDPFDLEDWAGSLAEPFDPMILRDGDGTTFLTTTAFDDLSDARDVRDRALALIAQLNGAMSIMHGTMPLKLNSILEADEQGARRHHMIIEATALAIGRCRVTGTGVALGPDGQPLPPPPPQPSPAQQWLVVSAHNDLVADMLAFLSRADNWYDLYKAIECAEALVGGERRLAALLGDTAGQLKHIRTTANFYRHARAYRPPSPLEIREALPTVRWVVRIVLDTLIPK